MNWDGGSGGYNYGGGGGSSNNVRYIPIQIDGGGPRPSQPQPYYPQPSGPSMPSAKKYPSVPSPNVNDHDGPKKVVKGLDKDDIREMEELTRILNNKKKQCGGGVSHFTPGPGPSPAAGSGGGGNNWDNQPFPIFKNPYLQEPTSTGGGPQPPQNQPSFKNPYSQPQQSFDSAGAGVPYPNIGFAMPMPPSTVHVPGQTSTSLPYPTNPTNPCPYPTPPGPNFYPGYPQ